MNSFWLDVRYGIRMLRKNRAVAIVVLILGLGIGINAAIFSVVNSFLLRPLPVKNADRLVVLAVSHPGNQSPHGLSYLDLLDFKRQTSALSDMAGFAVSFVGLTDHDYARRIIVSYVTGNYFSMLGLHAYLGRLILPTEGRVSGADPVLVLGFQCWQRQFGGDPTIVGHTVRINGRPFTIVGIVPSAFRGTYSMLEMDAYIPINMISIESGTTEVLTDRSDHRLNVLGNLKPGTSISKAGSELQVIANRLGKEYPATDSDLKMYVFPETLARPQPANALSNPPVAGMFLALVSLVLFVACVNVANILAARFASRQTEFAMRAALGATRARLGRQVITEGMMVAVLGGILGVPIGVWASWILGSIRLPVDLPVVFDFSFDWRVFAYTTVVVFGTGILIGLLPVLRRSWFYFGSLHETRGADTNTLPRGRIQDALVAAQVAGSVVLAITAVLFIRSLGALHEVDLGFRPDHVLNLVMDPHQIGYDQNHVATFYRELRERAATLPGVESASLASSIPMSDYSAEASVSFPGQPLSPNEKGLSAGYNIVGTDYFKTMGIQLVGGRAFADTDSEKSMPVAIVNGTLAEKLWPGQSPLGKHFTYKGPLGPFAEVIGLTANGKYGALSEAPQPFFYLPEAQSYSSLRVLEVRTAVPPEQLVKPIETLIHTIEPNLPVFDVATMQKSLQGGNGFFPFRVAAIVAGVVGTVGLLLAIVGVYGSVSYAAARRAHEIGIRVALGAQRGDILNLILFRGLRIVAVGLAIGVAVMLGVSRVISSFLFGIRPVDSFSYVAVCALLLAVAGAACYIPARRSTTIHPMEALRSE